MQDPAGLVCPHRHRSYLGCWHYEELGAEANGSLVSSHGWGE